MTCVSCGVELNPDDFPIKRSGTKYKCPVCGVKAKIIFKLPCYSVGMGIFPDRENDEFMLRYFQFAREYNAEDKTYTDLDVREVMRENFCQGYVYTKQKSWDGEWVACRNNRHQHYYYTRMGGWHGFLYSPDADFKRLYTSSLNIYAKGTQYERINLREYFKDFNPKDWWKVYSEVFYLMNYGLFAEYMQKVGLDNVLKDFRDDKLNDFDWSVNWKAKKLREMLDITQPQYKELLAKGSRATAEDVKRFHLINKWKLKTGEDWEIFNKHLRSLGDYDIKRFFDLFPYSLHKFNRYAEKQGNKFDVRTYIDYLKLAKDLNLDLKDTFVTFPDYLKEKHDDLLKVKQEREFDAKLIKYAKKADENADKFAPVVERTNRWCLADEQFVVVNPKSTHEIGYEGLKLRHCVAIYTDAVVQGEKDIMFLRKADEPETPHYTMEIIGDTITQCKGFRNTDRTKDVDTFLHKYAKKMHLKISDNETYQPFM